MKIHARAVIHIAQAQAHPPSLIWAAKAIHVIRAQTNRVKAWGDVFL